MIKPKLYFPFFSSNITSDDSLSVFPNSFLCICPPDIYTSTSMAGIYRIML